MRNTDVALALVRALEPLTIGAAELEISAAVELLQAALSGLRAAGGDFRPRLPLELRELVMRFEFICCLASPSGETKSG